MSKLNVDVEGFDKLTEQIRKLGNDKDKRREVLAILRKSAQPTQRAARQLAPRSKQPHVISGKTRAKRTIKPGNLSRSISLINGRKGEARENPTVYVGPKAGGTNDGFYGGWVHDGHNIYRSGFKRNRKGNAAFNATGARKRVQGQPFMAKAEQQTRGKVTNEIQKSMAAFLQKRIDRLS
jgi:HK97 gp10 family phage protein